MRRNRAIALAVIAALAVAGLMSATAMAAAPEYKPASGTLTVKSGAGKLAVEGGFFEISCKKDKGSGSITGAKTATFSLTFEECSTLGGFIKCNNISSSGTSLLGLSGSTTVIRFDPGTTEAVCGSVVDTITGHLVCPVSPVAKKVKTTEHYTVSCKQTSGKQEFTTFNSETGVTLKAKEGSGEAHNAGEETIEEVSNSVEGEIT
jgi:hypothetical protein